MITASTPWRTTGKVPYATWVSNIAAAGGPLELRSQAAYDAAGDLSGLALSMLGQESSYGTRFNRNVAENHNPLNLRPPGSDGYMAYGSWPDGIKAWHDRITDADYRGGIYQRTNSISDLINVYAPPSDSNDTAGYIADVVSRLNAWNVTQEADMSLTFGKVPYPNVVQSHLPGDNPMVETSGAPDIPDAVVWHRMIGTLLGTDGWFQAGHAATCYGIGCQATDGDANAGKIYEWIAPRTGWYGESSGPVSQPYGDGLALVNKVGINSVNRVTKAIEISGNYDTPLDEACRAAIVALTAYWADQKQIPWNEFPAVPGEDRSFVCWHREFTIGTGKICPGPVVMNETPALIARVATMLKSYQTDGKVVPKPPQYAKPDLPDWWEDAQSQMHPTDNRDGTVKYWTMRRNFVATNATRRLSAPDKHAPVSGPNVKAREKLFSERSVTTDATYVVTEDGHFVTASRLTPAVTIKNR